MTYLKVIKTKYILSLPIALAVNLCLLPSISLAEDGVSAREIQIGGVLDLEGRSKGLGQNMKAGIDAAFKGASIQNKKVNYLALNDSYNPKKTAESTKELINKKVFIFAGNVGTPTAKVSLPILAENNIPAVGFFTGAGLLRPGKGTIINYRASYIQETAGVIKSALNNGIAANNICAYVQNDAYGMAGIAGILKALKGVKGGEKTVAALEKIATLSGENPKRNGLGPVGTYKRNSYSARQGYLSLKAWEKAQNTQCKLVITVGSYQSISEFIAYSNYKKEAWIFSAVSFTGADNLRLALREFNIEDGIIMTQVVPPLQSVSPIVEEARQKLGDKLNFVSLEGFIVGKLVLHGLEKIEGNITRDSFTQALLKTQFDLGGLPLDFTSDNQGSDLVEFTTLSQGQWLTGIKNDIWKIKG